MPTTPYELSGESIVSPEAQKFVKVPVTIMKLKDKTRRLVWGRIDILDIEGAEEATYTEISQEEAELIDKISWGNMVKIQAILSNYY